MVKRKELMMGIRIHKSLGYGLDMSGFDYKITNDVLENEKWFKDLKTFFQDNDPDDYRMEKMYLKLYENNKQDQKYLYDHVIHDSEFGLENFIQFIPIGHAHYWKRYDDIIDYYEYTDDDLSPQIRWLNRPIYPYLNLMRKNPDKPFGIETYQNDRGTKQSNFAVPVSVMGMMHLLNIFPDDKLVDMFMMLRPCIYTYWS